MCGCRLLLGSAVLLRWALPKIIADPKGDQRDDDGRYDFVQVKDFDLKIGHQYIADQAKQHGCNCPCSVGTLDIQTKDQHPQKSRFERAKRQQI